MVFFSCISKNWALSLILKCKLSTQTNWRKRHIAPIKKKQNKPIPTQQLMSVSMAIWTMTLKIIMDYGLFDIRYTKIPNKNKNMICGLKSRVWLSSNIPQTHTLLNYLCIYRVEQSFIPDTWKFEILNSELSAIIWHVKCGKNAEHHRDRA